MGEYTYIKESMQHKIKKYKLSTLLDKNLVNVYTERMARKSVKYNSFNFYCLGLNLPLLLRWQQDLKLEKLNFYSNLHDTTPAGAGNCCTICADIVV